MDIKIHLFCLFKANQVRNNQIVSLAICSNNELRNAGIRKEIPENENPKKVIHIVEKVLKFNNRQKGNETLNITMKLCIFELV